MRIAVVGASGRTGSAVVELALRRGNEVVALSRRPEAVPLRHPRLAVLAADVLDAASLRAPLEGAAAVVSAIGVGTARQATMTYSQGATNLLAAMRRTQVGRLVVVSAVPVAPADELTISLRVPAALLRLVFRETYADMARMEAVLAESELAWTALRPSRLVKRHPSGHYRLDADRPPGGASISHGDLAAALLEVLERPDLAGRTVFVAG